MKPQDLFGLAIRLGGLYVLFYALWYLCYAGSQIAGLEPNQDGMGLYFLYGVFDFVLGLYFLRGAPHLVQFSYPETNDALPKDNS